MRQSIIGFGVVFTTFLLGASVIALNPLTFALGLGCAACTTFAIGWSVKAGQR